MPLIESVVDPSLCRKYAWLSMSTSSDGLVDRGLFSNTEIELDMVYVLMWTGQSTRTPGR